MAHIFISYATPDREVANEVSSWLRSAGHKPFLDGDLRDGISIGEDWKQRLYRELREVDAVIGVVTSSFVASNWCSAELGIADALGCRLMPLRAEADVVHPLMRDLQYADYLADPAQARDRVLRAVRLLDDGGDTWREGDNPFPGLEPFTSALRRVFFGRAAEAREVGNRLRARGSTGGMLVIVGPSGCGKSSLVNAAVVPLLESDPTWLTVPRLLPGSDPLPELARTLSVAATRLELDWSASDVRSRLEAGIDGLRRVADDLLAASPTTHQRLLVSIDQAEELFTRTTPAARQRFAELLSTAVTGPVQVVAAMRSEFLDDLRDLPALAGVPIEAYVLAPLDREMLRDVIEQPARVARLHLDDGLTAALVADTDSGEALPLLAFTLRQLASDLPAGATLTLTRYHDLGGVRGALTQHADAALTEAVQASGLTEHEILAGLTRLVTVDDTGRRARRRIVFDGLTESLHAALQVFVDRRLLLSDIDDNGQVWLAVAHEALLTGWRPLDTATTDITVALRTARTVEQAAADWTSADQSEHYLWDAERLTTTRAILGMANDSNHNPAAPPLVGLNDEGLAFLDATARRIRDAQERERRRRTRTMTVLSSLLVLALLAAGIAVWQQQLASGAQRTTIARGMVAQADRIRDSDPRGALQLGIAARQFDVSPQTHASLQQTLSSTFHFRTLRGHTDAVQEAAFAPDGRTLATASLDQTVRLWDLSDRNRPLPLGQPLTGHTGTVNGVVFAPDGRTLATGSADRTIRLWDVSDRNRPQQLGQPLTGHTGTVNEVVFAPDGRTLATGSADRTIRLWDVSDRNRPQQLSQPLTGHTGQLNGLAFASDGRTLATGGDQTIRLWDVSDRNRPQQLGQPLTGHTGGIYDLAFAPDGHTLATASGDRTIRLWDVSDRNRPQQLGQPLTGHTGTVNGVVFAPDGRTLATASGDQTVILWDSSDRDRPQRLGEPLVGHTGGVTDVALAPDGHTLATASGDQTVILWDLSSRPQPLSQSLTGHAEAVNGVALAPDGHTLATASGDRTVRLWDVSDRSRPRQLSQPLTGHTGALYDLAFAPDGRTLATASADRTVRLWDVSDRDRPHQLSQPLTGHTNETNAVAFAPDGRTLATVADDWTVRLWDVSDPDRPRQLGQPLTNHTGAVYGVAFAPDGRTLATGSVDRTVRLWDVSDRDRPRQLSQPLTGHTNDVNAVAFAPDGHTLATASADQTVRLWDVSDPGQPRQLSQPLTGHTGAVNDLAFTADGHTLATGSGDQTVRLWDVSDRDRPRQLSQPLTGHTGAVYGVAFAPHERTLATTSGDQTIIVWELPALNGFAGGEVREACLRAGGPLGTTMWDQHAPGVSYQDTCADH